MAVRSHQYSKMAGEAGPKELIKVLTRGTVTPKVSKYVISGMKPAYRHKIAFVANPTRHCSGTLTGMTPP